MKQFFETMKGYLDKLFGIVNKVRFQGIKFNMELLSIIY